MIDRRAFLGGLAGALLGSRAAAQVEPADPFVTLPIAPVLYVAHGGPNLAVSQTRGAELRGWAARLPPPRGVVAITPHVRSRGLRLTSVGPGRALISFPRRFLPNADHFRYATPDSAPLAARVRELLSARGEVALGGPGMNHTVWQPLLHMVPQAEAPVVELALPFGTSDADLFAIGERLAPLRGEGVWFLCSGNLTHNLGQMRVSGHGAPAWARRFDGWVRDRLLANDLETLVAWRRASPDAYLAHPDDGGHFDVLLVGLGVAAAAGGPVSFPVQGFEAGTVSKRCVQIG